MGKSEFEKRQKANRKAVKKAFKGGKANRDWKGSHTAKSVGKKGGGCAVIVFAVVGGCGALTALGTVKGWI